MNFETVIGLEVHCELKTKSKMFSGAPVTFGEAPNTNANIVDMGMTGAMPVLNKSGVEFAIRVCSALNMEIDELVQFDRKNYYYSDLPKGFQITQDRFPIGRNGTMKIEVNGQTQVIEIERLHMEEDTAKQLHFDDYSLIDYNRAGIPLIEIVTKPTIRSGAAAAAYLERLRQIFLFTEVSDAKMEEGSMRCDVNVSIRPYGSEKFGTRTEIKNMNSINNIAKAMEYEFERQVDLIENGGSVVQETLRYDDATNTTSSMRSKEDAHDYRYFRDPDLVTIHVPKDVVEEIKAAMPELPADKCRRYIDELAIPEKDAQLLTKYRKISEYFDKACEGVKSPKTVSNFIIGQIFRRTETEADKEIFDVAVTPEQLNELVKLLDSGKIRNNLAKATLEKMLDSGKGALEFISESDMGGLDESALNDLCKQAVESNPKAVEDYKNGKEKAIKSLVGNVMKNSRGKADPALAESKIKELIG